MRIFSRLPLYFLLLFFSTLYLGVFVVPVKADTTGFLSLINSYRQQNGIGILAEDQNLTNAACWFAADMGTNNYFPSDHVDSQGRSMSQRLTDFGISGSRAENIFYTTSGSGANYAFDTWKNSAGHNTNMLNSTYTRIGIGRANYNGKWYWVTDFASGSVTNLTNQCGQTVSQTTQTPPPPPSSPKKPAPVNTIPPVTEVSEPVPSVEITVATTTATISAEIATKSATKTPKFIKIEDKPKEENRTLVQGAAATTIVLGNLAIFGFIVFRLFRKYKFF